MKLSILVITLLAFASCKISGVKSVRLAKPRGSNYPYAQVEPSIAIHPKDQNIQIAGTVLDDYYYSKNAGKTWTSSCICCW